MRREGAETMVNPTRISPLRGLMKRRELTRSTVATAIGATTSQVAAWEKTLEGAPEIVVKDLAVLLDVPTGVLDGSEPDAELDRLYGTVKVWVPRRRVEYPIGEQARESLLSQIYRFDLQEDVPEGRWIQFETLNNKLVFLNPSFVQQMELLSDDAEASPEYDHPEVYSALEDWEIRGDFESGMGPVVENRCKQLVEAYGDAIWKQQIYTRVLTSKGGIRWHFLLGIGDTTGYFTLGLEATNQVKPNRFIRTQTEGYYRERFINLSTVAVVEVPINRYLRASDQEE
jgi:hypothetical protein